MCWRHGWHALFVLCPAGHRSCHPLLTHWSKIPKVTITDSRKNTTRNNLSITIATFFHSSPIASNLCFSAYRVLIFFRTASCSFITFCKGDDCRRSCTSVSRESKRFTPFWFVLFKSSWNEWVIRKSDEVSEGMSNLGLTPIWTVI